MHKKKSNITQGQVVGIAWISIGFILIVGGVFFCSRQEVLPTETDSTLVLANKKLEEKEDSVYRSRRQYPQASRPRTAPPAPAATTLPPPAAPPARRQPLMVELNTADTTTLMLLHGIGSTYARRIAGYRQRLGGFVDPAQLLEVYGFTPELLEHIAPHIHINADSLRRIPINSIDLKSLIRHPYIEYYQARDIINLRARGVHFSSLDDLRAVPSMADSTLRRLEPYLMFD